MWLGEIPIVSMVYHLSTRMVGFLLLNLGKYTIDTDLDPILNTQCIAYFPRFTIIYHLLT